MLPCRIRIYPKPLFGLFARAVAARMPHTTVDVIGIYHCAVLNQREHIAGAKHGLSIGQWAERSNGFEDTALRGGVVKMPPCGGAAKLNVFFIISALKKVSNAPDTYTRKHPTYQI